MVKKGVKAQFSSDNLTVTCWAYPGKRGGGPYKLSKHTWKNECPLCVKISHKKKPGKLAWNPKGVPEGELTCKQCGADFDAVTGKDKANKVRGSLKPATVTPNKTTKVAQSQTQSQKCTLTKAQALTKAKQLLKTGTGFKASLKIPILKNINLGDRLQVNLEDFPETKNKKLFVSEIKEDIDNQTLDLTLQESKYKYTIAYDGDYIMKDKKGTLLGASSKNPLQTKCTNINMDVGLKDSSEIGKEIKLKGQELGTVRNIYRWLRVKSAGGEGGWKYQKYNNHKVKSESYKKFGPKSAKKVWKSKKANCCDFSWLFAKMCEGAGRDVDIRRGDFVGLDGKKSGHMWNVYDGKQYDCSSSTDMTIELKKVEPTKKK